MPWRTEYCSALTALVILTVGGCAVSVKPRSAECTIGTIFAGGAGCAPLPREPDAADDAAKRFAPTSGKANIYVVRPSIVGGRHLWNIEIDGKPAGQIAEHTYLLFEVEPGSHEVAAVTGENRHALVVDASLGESLVLEVVSRMGLTESRAELRALALDQGRAAVRSAKRVKSR